jgi:hypothetical protein
MAKPVECGESANRIERVRLINDALPLGQRIRQTLPACALYSLTLESLRRLMNAIAA